MVIVRLYGGIGNQLFQYATARHIAHLNAVELRLDLTPFETYKLHAYGLRHFNIRAALATAADIERLKGRNRHGLFVKGLRRLGPYYRRARVVERDFRFDPNILRAPGHVYLEGYWQSEKYFADITSLLREELRIITPPDPANLALANRISAVDAVSVHVRRKDFISDDNTRQIHGTCSIDYYQRAAELIATQCVHPDYFVFSDEPEWARDNLRLPGPTTVVDHNGPDRNYEDLRLMSLCRHQIIANSSFGWWGAWLCPHPGKTVIAPRQWFQTTGRHSHDLLPASWTTL